MALPDSRAAGTVTSDFSSSGNTTRARGTIASRTGFYREIETAVPDERILVLFVPNILLTRSYNIKVNIFGLNEVKIEIESPGAALCTCLVPNLYSLRYPK